MDLEARALCELRHERARAFSKRRDLWKPISNLDLTKNKGTMALLSKRQRPTAVLTCTCILWWLAGQTETAAFVGAPTANGGGGGIHQASTRLKIVAAESIVAEDQTTELLSQEQEEEKLLADWVHQSFDETPSSDPSVENNVVDFHEFEPRPFPFSMIVDLEHIKKALMLAAVNPNMGGVVISGRRGTAKSVLARAMQRLVPSTIERIKGSPYNVDPSGQDGIDSTLQAELEQTNTFLQDLPTERVATPFVQIPLNAMVCSIVVALYNCECICTHYITSSSSCTTGGQLIGNRRY